MLRQAQVCAPILLYVLNRNSRTCCKPCEGMMLLLNGQMVIVGLSFPTFEISVRFGPNNTKKSRHQNHDLHFRTHRSRTLCVGIHSIGSERCSDDETRRQRTWLPYTARQGTHARTHNTPLTLGVFLLQPSGFFLVFP